MKNKLNFAQIFAKFEKASIFFHSTTEKFLLVFCAANDETHISGKVIAVYVNSEGVCAYRKCDLRDLPRSIEERQNLQFDAYGVVKDLDAICISDLWKRATINHVANSFAKKGYARRGIVWALWNSPESKWMAKTSLKRNTQEILRREVERCIVLKKCENLVKEYGKESAIWVFRFGTIKYDLILGIRTDTDVQKGEQIDFKKFPMNIKDVRHAESLLKEPGL